MFDVQDGSAYAAAVFYYALVIHQTIPARSSVIPVR